MQTSQKPGKSEILIRKKVFAKTVFFFKFLKNISNAGFTEYGLRILLENLNFPNLKYLNVSSNAIGNKGVEHLTKYLQVSK